MHALFVFFKQKTAYEMRISDWSSDVCSSDLTPFMLLPVRQSGEAVFDDDNRAVDDQTEVERAETHQVTGHAERVHAHRHHQEGEGNDQHREDRRAPVAEQEEERDRHEHRAFGEVLFARSAEHTSELQTLMR